MSYQTSPARLLDHMIQFLDVKNDAGLARILRVGPPTICKARFGTIPISPEMLLRMHDLSGLSIRDLRYLAGDTRPHTGRSAVPAN